MPPKVKPKKASSKKKVTGKKGKKEVRRSSPTLGVQDGYITQEMTKEQMEEHILRLREELDREREERNYFQLERDKINTFWEIAKKQLEEKSGDFEKKDRLLKEREDQHQIEIKVYKQKVKHLLYEHQNALSEAKADNTVHLQLAEEAHYKEEAQIRQDKTNFKVELKNQELAHEDLVKKLTMKHDQELLKLRSKFEKEMEIIESNYDEKLKQVRQEIEMRRKTELHEIEERKNNQIQLLMKNHERAFTDIKNYYNDVTLNNLALINTLREQMEEMKKKEERVEKLMSDMSAENHSLKDPLRAAEQSMAQMKKELTNYSKDKTLLVGTKTRLKTAQEDLNHMKWEYEVLAQRFKKAEEERDSLYEKFEAAILEVQRKTGLKNLVLEKKLTAIHDTLEKKEAQLNEVLSATNLDPQALQAVTKKLEDVLDSKNQAIRELQHELARVSKAHQDIQKAYDAKLRAYGVNPDDLGFRPVPVGSGSAAQRQAQLGQGPAGLVSRR